MNLFLKDHQIFLGLTLIHGLMLYINSNSILFWDTIQFAGKHTSYFYENGLQNGILLPDAIDSGHPPTFAFYICVMWKIFGKCLVVSHWAMYPFLIGITYQLVKVGEFALHRSKWLFPLLVFLCPFYLGQSILVSPDIVLLFGFLLMLRGHCYDRKLLILTGAVVLSLISLRGMALVFCFFLYDLYTDRIFTYKSIIHLGCKKLLIYLPAVFIGLSFLIYHYLAKGWVSHHADSPWNYSYTPVDLFGFIKNVLFTGHRFVDFGMIFIYTVLLWKIRYLAILKGRLIWLWLFILIITAFLVLPYQGLLNHRYFLPLQILAILMACQVMLAMKKKFLIAIIGIGVFSGNFWIYPDRISQGWDSTFAHQAYYKEVEKFQIFAKKQRISTSNICTVFPLKGEQKFRNLDDNDHGIYRDFHKEECSYVLYSNVMNDFTDEELLRVQSRDIVYRSKSRGVSFILYK